METARLALEIVGIICLIFNFVLTKPDETKSTNLLLVAISFFVLSIALK